MAQWALCSLCPSPQSPGQHVPHCSGQLSPPEARLHSPVSGLGEILLASEAFRCSLCDLASGVMFGAAAPPPPPTQGLQHILTKRQSSGNGDRICLRRLQAGACSGTSTCRTKSIAGVWSQDAGRPGCQSAGHPCLTQACSSIR